MKIGDLWVKLGLKKDEFSKGIKEAGNETDKLGALTQKAAGAAKAAWAALGAAVVKFATDAVRMTQKWGDEWRNTMAGVKGAYSSFVRQLSSGEGWDNLFANMREAYRVSKEVAAALDEIFERKTSFSYQEASTDREIARLTLIARDSSKSDEERKKANEEIIRLTNELGESKKKIWTDEAAANRRLFQLQTGLNDEQTDFLVKEYNQNREVIQQAREYLRLKKEYSSVKGSGDFFSTSVAPIPTPVANKDYTSPALEKLERETPQYIKDVASLTQAYDKANDELVKGMADAEVSVIRIDTETMHAQTRATALLGTLNKAAGTRMEIDMETPLARAQENMGDVLDDAMDHLDDALKEMKPVEFEPLEIVPPDFTEWDDFYNKYQDDLQRMQDLLTAFRDAGIQGFSDAVQELADQFMGLSDINPGKVVQALLTPLADMAIKEGEILIAQGIGVEACKEALESLNGWAAIAAGASLVAIGAAAKSGLAALAQGGGRSTATTSYGTSSSSNSNVQTIQTEMTVYVTGRISGNDILLSGKKTQDSLNR